MKIYSDKITEVDVQQAFAKARVENGADIWIDEIRSFRPRGPKMFGVEVWAESMNGSRASAHGPIGSYDRSYQPRAASWTDYGYVMAHLFNIDPDAKVGFYSNRADFVKRCTEYPRTDQGNSLKFLDILEGAT